MTVLINQVFCVMRRSPVHRNVRLENWHNRCCWHPDRTSRHHAVTQPARSPPPTHLRSTTAIVVSNMVGTAIFTSMGYNAGDLGDPILILWLWVLGAVCALAGAFCYSELGVNFPSSGGEYVYLTQAFGPEWGFMTGWISFVAGFSAPIVTSGLACAAYLSYFFPALHPDKSLVTVGSGPWSIRWEEPRFSS